MSLNTSQTFVALSREQQLSRSELVAWLVGNPGQFASKLRERARRRLMRVLLFVDQFEEIYTLVEEQERDSFIRCLKAVADDAGSPLRLVFTIRSDFLDRLGWGHEKLDQQLSQSVLAGPILGEMKRALPRLALIPAWYRICVSFCNVLIFFAICII